MCSSLDSCDSWDGSFTPNGLLFATIHDSTVKETPMCEPGLSRQGMCSSLLDSCDSWDGSFTPNGLLFATIHDSTVKETPV
jgi:hypothetical protein